jgi:Phosphotransferase enzyme family
LAYLRVIHAIRCRSWTDFGHLQTYYASRAEYASTRAFNELRIEGGVVRKTGEQLSKIRAEARWFEALPRSLLVYSARLLDSCELPNGRWQYETEYEHLPTLQELFVFGRLSERAWDEILTACCSCLEDFSKISVPDAPSDPLLRLTRDKSWDRLAEFERQSGTSLRNSASLCGKTLPSPIQIAEEMMTIVCAAPPRTASVMHGDFCFSNILFSGRTRRIRLIDPRGTVDGISHSCVGDPRYDMAKLAHSALGFYDLVIAGCFECKRTAELSFELEFDPPPGILSLANRFRDFKAIGIRFGDPVIMATMVLLFLSMLTLHKDRPDRQWAFLANALRLYSDHFGGA